MQVSISPAAREIADAAGIEAALLVLQLVDDLHRAHLRRARHGAGREARGERVERVVVRVEPALDVGDDVHHLAVALDEELVGDLDACRSRRRGRHRCGRDRAASDARRAPSDRPRSSSASALSSCGVAPRGACRRSGGSSPRSSRTRTRISGLGAGHREAAEIEKVEVRATGWCGAARGRARTAAARTAPRSAATAPPGRCRRRAMYSFAALDHRR